MFKTTTARFVIAMLAMTGAQAMAASWTDFLDFDGLSRNTKLEKLATITNDRSSDYNVLSGMVDDQNNLAGVDFAVFEGGHQSSSAQFSMKKISTATGVVLINVQGYDAVLLRGKVTGGEADLIVKFLYNGMTSEYHECKVQAVRSTDNTWHMKNAYTGKIFDKVKIITSSFGISNLQGLCPN